MVEHSYFDVHTDQWHTNGHAAERPAPEAAIPSARQLWREAVAQAAEKARAALPEANGRIDRAVRLVLAGDVQILEDGTAMVGSLSDPATTYHVNGACTCQDAARAPHEGMCQHRIARGLAIRAQQRLEERMDHLDSQAAQPTPAPAPAASLPEAPASANAFVVIDGHRVQVTVRGHTLAGVLTEIRTVLAQFPAEAAAQPPTPPPAPAAAAAPEPTGMKPCPVHPGELMQLNTKNGQQWHSHRLADGTWCKGRVKQS
jgi:hypothetical protein